MASDINYVNYIKDQLASAGELLHKKMFGEYLIYLQQKPVITVCDNTAFVKVLPQTTAILSDSNPTGYPYQGAKLHYILDIDDT